MSRQLVVLLVVALVGAFGAGAATAATAPSATTGPVSSIGPTSATVTGTVNPNGTPTTWLVEYGTSTGYGSSTSSTNAGSGTSNVAVSVSLSGLKAGTTYHYRVVATSTAGTTRGADGILTTSAAPQVVTGSASNVTPTSATLNGSVDPSGRATTWYFEYGTTTGYGNKTATKDAGSGTGAANVSASISGLTAGRTYHYRLTATSDAGTSHGNDQTFVASAQPNVTTRSVSSIRDNSATLNSTVNPNGSATTVYFEFGTTTSYGSKSSSKSIGSGRSAQNVAIGIGGLAANTTYHVRVVAENANGSNRGSDVTFTTTGRPFATAGSASGVNSNAATLTGTVNPNGHAASWYFQYGTTTSYGQQTPTRNSSSQSGSRNVTEAIGNLTAGTTYHYRLVATNSIGTSFSNDVSFTTSGPPLTLTVSSRTVVLSGSVTLTGKLASGRSNESVVVFAQRYASGSFFQVATVLTDAGGGWSLRVRPRIATTYKSVWNGNTSATVTVGVHPAVSLRALGRLRFATHVAGTRSFKGRIVQLQRRRLNGSWVTISRARLNASSNAVFHPRLGTGRSTLRVAFSVNQAGGGYLAGFSRAITIRRS
jgi:phosphodiesterase/alkaline phosphatase D-like protein